MSKNSLINLNDHLFEQIERLNDDETLEGENFEKEIKRAKAMTGVAQAIISNASIALEAKKYVDEYGDNTVVPEMFRIEKK